MFLIVTVFLFVLLLSFGVVMLLTRPSATQRVIQGRVARLNGGHDGAAPALPDEVSQLIKPTRLSAMPWIDNLLRNISLAQKVQLLIAQAESGWTVSGVLGASILLCGMAFAAGYYEMPSVLVALLPAVAGAASPFMVLRFQRQRRLKLFNRYLPEAVDLMARALRGTLRGGGD